MAGPSRQACERLLVGPVGDDEVAVLALDRAQQLEAEEAGRPVDGVRAVAEPLLQLAVCFGRDGDGVDLHDGHVSSLGGCARRSTSLSACRASATSSTCSTAGTRPHTADAWDAVGLVYGDPAAEVSKVMFAVDPAPEVAREAAEWGADLLVVHHPLFLKPVHGFAATTPKGRTLTTLASAGCALLTAHTNADRADRRGVRGAGARPRPARRAPARGERRRGGRQAGRLRPGRRTPTPYARSLADAGAGRIGDYDHASFSAPGTGRFRPLEGANPAIGAVGQVESVAEERVEVRAARGVGVRPSWRRCSRRTPTRSRPTTSSSWPTRGPPPPAPAGSATVDRDDAGRRSRDAWPRRCPRPPTASGWQATRSATGAPGRGVRRRRRLPARRVLGSGADVYVTSDLRHHPAREFLEQDGPALVDVAHWAAEWTWLPVVQARVRRGAGRYGGDPREHAAHRPVAVPPLKEPTLKADPFAQLKLLDVQELDAGRPAAAPAGHPARARRDRRARAERARADDQRARRPDRWSTT